MKIRLTITLEMEAESAEMAQTLVENVLDRGDLQDGVNEFAEDDGADAVVTSALLKSCVEVAGDGVADEDEDEDEDFEDLPPELTCSACGGELVALGALGNRAHFRCRACGLDSSVEVTS